MPGEDELGRELGLTPYALRDSIRALALLGLVELQRDAPPTATAAETALYAGPGASTAFLDGLDYVQLHRARESLEMQLAGEAAAQATAADMEALRAALNDPLLRGDPTQDPLRRAVANVHFHMAIARAAHNPVLERLLMRMHVLRRAMVARMVASGKGRLLPLPGENNEVHERIYAAIADHDVAAARRAMAVDMGIALRGLSTLHGESLPLRCRQDRASHERTLNPRHTHGAAG